MSRFPDGTHLPRATGSNSWQPLIDLRGRSIDEIKALPVDLRSAEFHPAAARRVEVAELEAWRGELNSWASDRGFPSDMNETMRSAWDVELGQRLLADTEGLPEAQHPDVWCWLATNLLPHLVVYRWGWPELTKDGEVPTGRSAWVRFGDDLRNGLHLAMHRIIVYGPDLASHATEQEFQSVLNRPAFGRDRRVAAVVMSTLRECLADEDSNYGKNGGTRTLDADDVCIELRVINSLRPLCFAPDDEIRGIVKNAVERLPEYRKESNRAGRD